MIKGNYCRYEAKEDFGTLSFNHVILHKKDTKMCQVIIKFLLRWKQ